MDKRIFISLAALAALLTFISPIINGAETGKKYYLFSYFRAFEKKRDGSGLHLAWSEDGCKWKKLRGGKLFFKPSVSSIMRDPSITRGPDGRFHLVWTTGWVGRNIGYASSKDLIKWENEKLLPVMEHEPRALNCWAPELFYDDATGKFIIYWSTTIPGRFPETDGMGTGERNHRIYYVTTENFETFTPTKLLYDPGFNCIDAFIIKDGIRYVMFVKNETTYPPAKYLFYAESSAAEGPWKQASEQITPQNLKVEGPAVLKINGKWHLYFDVYNKFHFGLLVSEDLKTWQDMTDSLDMPFGARHGTMFEIEWENLKILLNRQARGKY